MKKRLAKLLKRFAAGLAVFVSVTLLATLAVHKDGSVYTDIWINSPPQATWQVLTATAEYPAWNPEISRLDGQLREGNVIGFTDGSGPNSLVFHPTVTCVRPNQELRWKGSVWLPGIFDGEHRFRLEARGGRTHFIQSEKFTGLFVGAMTQAILRETAAQMQAMNLALKARAEASRQRPHP